MKKIEFMIDDKLETVVEQIKEKIEFGEYDIGSFSQFLEISILVFSKLLENKIGAEQFDFFIDSCKVNESNKIIEA